MSKAVKNLWYLNEKQGTRCLENYSIISYFLKDSIFINEYFYILVIMI